MFLCVWRWMLAVSEDEVPQWAASRNLITHSTGNMSPQPCIKPGRWNIAFSYRGADDHFKIYVSCYGIFLCWSYQLFLWCNIPWRLCSDWQSHPRITPHPLQTQPKPSGWMRRRGWGGCRSVYTEASCGVNENLAILYDINIHWCKCQKKRSLQLSSCMHRNSEWLKELKQEVNI